jgi:hypothetical protein
VRASIALALLAAVLAVGTASATPPTPIPGYLSDDYATVTVASNASWTGAKPVAKPTPITTFPKSRPELYAPIWASTCTAGAQAVRFKREVWLPGPPNAQGSFVFSVYSDNGLLVNSLAKIDVFVNHKVVFRKRFPRTNTSTTVRVDAAASRTFRFGENSLEVRVEKRATKIACNKGSRSHLGVFFYLTGHFATDLAVPPSGKYDRFKKLDTGESTTQVLILTVGNVGPAWVPDGQFHLSVCCTQLAALNGLRPEQLGRPFKNCKLTESGSQHDLDCGLTNFDPERKGTINFFFGVHAPLTDYGDFKVSVAWSVSPRGVQDLDFKNNQGGAEFTFCGKLSTNPGCKTATG